METLGADALHLLCTSSWLCLTLIILSILTLLFVSRQNVSLRLRHWERQRSCGYNRTLRSVTRARVRVYVCGGTAAALDSVLPPPHLARLHLGLTLLPERRNTFNVISSCVAARRTRNERTQLSILTIQLLDASAQPLANTSISHLCLRARPCFHRDDATATR